VRELILDVDSALKFLALDKAVIHNDGFWVRASDFSIYEEPNGKFHMIPWDANETFREPEAMGGPGGGRGRGGFFGLPGDGPGEPGGPEGGIRGPGASDATLDPFVGADDPNRRSCIGC
jgi:spore coat protein CotH